MSTPDETRDPRAPAPTPSIARSAGYLLGALAARAGYFELERGFNAASPLPPPEPRQSALSAVLDTIVELLPMVGGLLPLASKIGDALTPAPPTSGAADAPFARPIPPCGPSGPAAWSPSQGIPTMIPMPDGTPLFVRVADSADLLRLRTLLAKINSETLAGQRAAAGASAPLTGDDGK